MALIRVTAEAGTVVCRAADPIRLGDKLAATHASINACSET